jgi:hypothetical protein
MVAGDEAPVFIVRNGMKTRNATKTIALLLAILLLSSCGKHDEKRAAARDKAKPEQAFSDEEFLLRKGHAGRVRLGAFVDTLPRLFPAAGIARSVDTMGGQKEYRVYVADSTGRPLMKILQDCTKRCRIERITIVDNRYKTADFLGIGTRFADLKKRHKIGWTDLMDGKAVAFAEDLGMIFFFPAGKYPASIHRRQEVPIDDSARALKVVIAE